MTAWWMASVMVMPEYDSYRPRLATQATNSWCRRRNRSGSMCDARAGTAVLLPALPGRNGPATGSPLPPGLWSTKAVSNW
jgi:hypothetical protein